MKQKLKIAIIGGGASGMMAAIRSAENFAEVTLFEKNSTFGRKLSITGKGRCNLTNIAENSEVIKNIPGNGKFLFSALKNFSSADTINFFESLGLKTKVERGGRVFPKSDNANEVIEVLTKKIFSLGILVKLNSKVTKITFDAEKNFCVECGSEIFYFDKVILATGGASYPATGSTGDGFKFAKNLGHKVTEILPSLVPLEVEEDFIKNLQGLSLKNVRATLSADGKKSAEIFGEMLFTHFGISGPIILTLSRQVAKLLAEKKFVELKINLKPALSFEQLDARILRDFENFQKKSAKNVLVELLPKKMIEPILDLSFIDAEKKVTEITKAERLRLIKNLREFTLTITKTRPIAESIVTSGGVSVKEINPKTMESKILPGLFIVGEVLDVDGFTGGFNLQAAWASGNAAGIFAAKNF